MEIFQGFLHRGQCKIIFRQLVNEISDESHKIEPFIDHIKPYFEKAGKGYIVTLDETTVLMHKTGSKK